MDEYYECGTCQNKMRLAIENGHTQCLNRFLDNDKNPNKIYENIWGMTPLNLAVKNNKISIIKLLLDRGANLNGVGNNIETIPIFGANYECTKILIENGANINIAGSREDDNWTPLFFAVNYNRIDVAKLLLDNGADLYYKDINGDTVFDIWSNEETKIFLREYHCSNEQLEVKDPGFE